MIYVAQFGALWRLTPAAWASVVDAGLCGQAFDLDQLGQRLERRPPFIYRDERGRFNIGTNRHRLYQPLDWDDVDWAEALAEIASDQIDALNPADWGG